MPRLMPHDSRLSGDQYSQFHEAMLDAYDDVDELEAGSAVPARQASEPDREKEPPLRRRCIHGDHQGRHRGLEREPS